MAQDTAHATQHIERAHLLTRSQVAQDTAQEEKRTQRAHR